jgi:arabinose-5-phosphate isomerase
MEDPRAAKAVVMGESLNRHTNTPNSPLEAAQNSIDVSAGALSAAAARLDGEFVRALDLILGGSGRVIVTGVGKSGHVARKIAGTFCSIGTPAAFLHPVDALHGDLGLCEAADTAILISKSGSTAELLRLAPILRESRLSLIGILGNVESPLARAMDVVLDGSVRCESDPHNLLPTASALTALALGDALAIGLMTANNFTPKDFSLHHPSGQLGRNLKLTVRDVMHTDDEVAWAIPGDSVKDLIVAMTRRPLGAACIVDGDHRLVGLVTDGDLRRALLGHDDIRPLRAADIMTKHPATIEQGALLRVALQLMEDRPSQISVMPVVDPDGALCVGLIRIHDIYQSGAAGLAR